MDILEMFSFNFQEFVTSPGGICIIVGILFLIVGIAFYLKDGKKSNKTEEVKEEKVEENKALEASTPAQPEVAPVAEPTTTAPEVTTTPEVKPVVENVAEATPIVVQSSGEGVKDVPVAPVAETINFNEVSTSAPAVVNEVKPETLDTPVVAPVAPTVAPVAPAVESLDATPSTTPTIYGGASPEVSKAEVLEEKPREVYGGANPLENTSPIPTNVVRDAYEATAEAPVAPVAVTPEVSVTPVAPVAVTPVASVTPVVQSVAPEVAPVTPAVEPVVQTTASVAPTVASVAPTVAPVEPAPVEKKEEIEKLEF